MTPRLRLGFREGEGFEAEFLGLGEEGGGVVVEDLEEGLEGVAAALCFEHGAVGLEGVGDAPVGGGVDAELVVAVDFDHVDGALWGAFGDGVDGHSGPVAGVFDEFDGVFFDVVDEDAGGIEGGAEVVEHVEDHAGAFEFVFEVWGVDEDEVVFAGGACVAGGFGFEGVDGELDVLLEDFGFVGGVFVEADFADAEDGGAGEEFGDFGEDFAGLAEVFGFLGVEADPGVVLDGELGGAFGFGFGELAEVVEEAGGGAVVAGPEGGFGDGADAGEGHGFVVGGGAGDHVAVGVDEEHFASP